MSDVACIFGPAMAEVQERGVRPEKLLDGLGLDLQELADPRRRIPWDSFTELLRRARDIFGTEAFEEIAATSAEKVVPRLFRRLLPILGDAKPLYLMGARWWGPWIFRTTRSTCEQIADGRLREVIEILPEYGESPEFFLSVRGMLRVPPLLFGQPEPVIELWQNGRRGEFIISAPPARRTWLGFRSRRSVSALPEELEELGFRQEQLRDGERRARVATEMLAKKSRRLETVAALGNELTQQRGVGSLVVALNRLLAEQFAVGGVRLSCGGKQNGSDGHPLRARAGSVVGPAGATFALRVGGRAIGSLELWGIGDEGLGEDDTFRLRELLPWIAVALENAQAADQVGELTKLLEVEIADWKRVGQALEQAIPNRRVGGAEKDTFLEGSETILLVEDDDLLRRRCRRKFETAGHAVLEAASNPGSLPRPVEGSAGIQWLVSDWGRRSVTPEYVHRVRQLYPDLIGVLLMPLRQL